MCATILECKASRNSLKSVAIQIKSESVSKSEYISKNQNPNPNPMWRPFICNFLHLVQTFCSFICWNQIFICWNQIFICWNQIFICLNQIFICFAGSKHLFAGIEYRKEMSFLLSGYKYGACGKYLWIYFVLSSSTNLIYNDIYWRYLPRNVVFVDTRIPGAITA